MSSTQASSKGKTWFYLFIGTAITVVLLSWALRDVSLWDVGQQLRHSQWQWLVVGWLAYMAVYVLRACRWGTLLKTVGNTGRWRSRFDATLIGFGASSPLPAHAGELIRPIILNRLDQVPMEASLGTILVERLLDVGVVFILLLVPLWLGILPDHPALADLGLTTIGGIIILVWLMLLVGAQRPKAIAQFLGVMTTWVGLGRFQSRLTAWSCKFLSGLGALRSPRQSLIALVQTVIIWLLNGITYWAGLVAFGILSPGFLGALFVQSSTALAIALPSTPGYIGPFEAGIRGSLDIFNIPGELSIACAVALRLIMYGTIPVIAAVLALHLGLSWADIKRPPLAPSTSEPRKI